MKIGVDAGALCIRDDRLKVGVYRVTYNLLKHLAAIDKKNQYRLYTFAPLPFDPSREFGANFHEAHLRPSIGWSRIRLPLELRLRPVDVFLGLSQHLPSVGRAKSIGFIYDTSFLDNPEYYPGSYERLVQQTRDVAARADEMVTISEYSRMRIRHHYPHTRSIHVAYPGVDEPFSPTGEKESCEHPYLLFVGSLKKSKNVPQLLRVYSRLRYEYGNGIDLRIVGGDYWRDQEIDAVSGTEGKRGIHFTGYVSDEQLARWYRGAVACISLSRSEGFGLPLAEAMACGCPVIASGTGASAEVVGSAGLLVDGQDLDGTVKQILMLLKSKSKRNAYRLLGLRRAKRFRWESFARAVYDLYP